MTARAVAEEILQKRAVEYEKGLRTTLGSIEPLPKLLFPPAGENGRATLDARVMGELLSFFEQIATIFMVFFLATFLG